MPWNGITPEAGVKLMKHALENGANFWNGVRRPSSTAIEPMKLITSRPSSTAQLTQTRHT